jgi:plastocyanin
VACTAGSCLIGGSLLGIAVLGAAAASATTKTGAPATTPLVTAPLVTSPAATAPSTTATTLPTPPVGDPFEPVPPPGSAATASVSIVDFGFSPATITVAAGTTVTWVNTGQSIHSVTSDTGAFDSNPSCPTGPCLDPGASYSHAFAAGGRFAYHCRVHPNMTGTVVVNAPPPSTTTTTSAAPGTTGGPPVTGGGGAGATTSAPGSTGPQLAFTGASTAEAWLVLGALLTISIGLALRPRRRPFPIPVAGNPTDRQ